LISLRSAKQQPHFSASSSGFMYISSVADIIN
jgi:hypothetical protein